ncbi:MAG: DUF2726 domain-containing protein [Lachnospiraceae bacterium]|nr:DUF2726 domain-containing protein [Lachnospiraceae bacterium]
MDTSRTMIIAKGEICIDKIISCELSSDATKYNITFKYGKRYSYSASNVIVMTKPKQLNPLDYVVISSEGKRLFDIQKIYQFEHQGTYYWHIVFDKFEKSYPKKSLEITKNCLTNKKSKNVFEYLKEISVLSNIPNECGDIILKKRYEMLKFVPEKTVLSLYLNPENNIGYHPVDGVIFPFGCNESQYQAVRNALDNQMSVIQGPPGTGKTQTILNIIANILIAGKTIIMVSNNNSATLNVLEKLAKDQYGMDFLVAPLGNVDNKTSFVEKQTGKYPNLSGWVNSSGNEISLENLKQLSNRLQKVYQLRENIARLKEKRYEIELELKHFNEYAEETAAFYDAIKIRGKISSQKTMRLWQELQSKADNTRKLTLFFKLRSILLYGIADWNFYKQDLSKIITVLQGLYYNQSLKEIDNELVAQEKELEGNSGDYEKQLEADSLLYLKNYLAHKYNWESDRVRFTEKDLYRMSNQVLCEYPIVLSTTFSARSSLNMDDVLYDYVIMDEASQVDIATGALALSCAKNAVIVGDLKQLPNVVTQETLQQSDWIRKKYSINDAYDFGHKSFLQSVVDVLPDVPSTLLKEHYRCHPRIISFCNQKFYNGELAIMTDDNDSENALMAVKTVEGNHARGNYNQRQIDIIKNEILPQIDEPLDEIGIIAPYNDQADAIQNQISGVDVATVHKFQGREKNVIILSTVDDKIKDFTDNPYLLNVAVSRAKKRLIVVVTGNEQDKNGNIVDLISYIQYNKMEVVDSQIYSVFDYLYTQYREKRREYLKGREQISEYDSENLTYSLLVDILKEHPEYGVVCHEPLSMIIRDMSKLSDEEVRYAMHPSTHIDFLVFNKLSKQPIAAIETDGYKYHKDGTTQHERDLKKNHILELCGLPLVRLKTNGSGEKERILNVLGLE